ncbi:hypothetical protein CLOP_g19514 [Closterium sp. NIES-67]|nr:hypothetical protein CLOP_g19514 [Closterium sp. NIES-67]
MPISLHTSSPCTSPPIPRCPSSTVNRDKSLHGDRSMGPFLVVGEILSLICNTINAFLRYDMIHQVAI